MFDFIFKAIAWENFTNRLNALTIVTAALTGIGAALKAIWDFT